MTTQTTQVEHKYQPTKLQNLRSSFAERIPARSQVFPVFSIIVFFVFTWALYRISDQLPSWLRYVSFSNIVTLFFYVLASAFLESLVVLGFVLLICLVFPVRFFKGIFVAQGSAFVLILSLAAILLQYNTYVIYSLQFWPLIGCTLLFLVALIVFVPLFASLFKRFKRLQSLLEAFASRMRVFGYLYTLIGLISLIVVLVRLIF
jgi:hypothetical protein